MSRGKRRRKWIRMSKRRRRRKWGKRSRIDRKIRRTEILSKGGRGGRRKSKWSRVRKVEVGEENKRQKF